jgi:hypothetical protein
VASIRPELLGLGSKLEVPAGGGTEPGSKLEVPGGQH